MLSQGIVGSQSTPQGLVGMNLHFSHQAPIAPGSSGGALICLNSQDEEELCGINTAVGVKEGKLISNFGMSIRMQGVVSRLLPKLERERSVSHPLMGIALVDTKRVNPIVYETFAKSSYPPDRPGVMVLQVARNSPAGRSGIQPGDMIRDCEILLEGQWVKFPITSAAQFTEDVFFGVSPGTRMRLKTQRGPETLGREFELDDFRSFKRQPEH